MRIFLTLLFALCLPLTGKAEYSRNYLDSYPLQMAAVGELDIAYRIVEPGPTNPKPWSSWAGGFECGMGRRADIRIGQRRLRNLCYWITATPAPRPALMSGASPFYGGNSSNTGWAFQ